MMEKVEGLPQSTALDEAKPESISEITGIDPEKWTEQDLERLVEFLRAGAERRAKGLAEERAKPKRASAATAKPPKSPVGTLDDLGI